MSSRPDQARNPLFKPRRPSGYDRSVRIQARMPDHPLGDWNIGVALDSEVDDSHALAS